MRLVNIAFIAFFSTISVTYTVGQSMTDIFDRKGKMTWLGIDFSKAKFIGGRERFGSESDTRHLIDAWNDLMRKEKDKFYIKSAVKKDQVEDGIDVAKEHNVNVEVMDMFVAEQNEDQHLTRSDVDAIIADYDFKGFTGPGVIFIVESFNENKKRATVWVTFVNMNSKEIYFTEMVTGYPGGAGVRNNWANSIKVIMDKMRDDEFEKWRKKYNPKR